jgi:hypothetical protein
VKAVFEVRTAQAEVWHRKPYFTSSQRYHVTMLKQHSSIYKKKAPVTGV